MKTFSKTENDEENPDKDIVVLSFINNACGKVKILMHHISINKGESRNLQRINDIPAFEIVDAIFLYLDQLNEK